MVTGCEEFFVFATFIGQVSEQILWQVGMSANVGDATTEHVIHGLPCRFRLVFVFCDPVFYDLFERFSLRLCKGMCRLKLVQHFVDRIGLSGACGVGHGLKAFSNVVCTDTVDFFQCTVMGSKNVTIKLTFEDLIAVATKQDPARLGAELNVSRIRPEIAVFGIRRGGHGIKHGMFPKFAA